MTDKRYLPEGGLFGTPQNTEYISSREMHRTRNAARGGYLKRSP